jgi:hypothetical protein
VLSCSGAIHSFIFAKPFWVFITALVFITAFLLWGFGLFPRVRIYLFPLSFRNAE